MVGKDKSTESLLWYKDSWLLKAEGAAGTQRKIPQHPQVHTNYKAAAHHVRGWTTMSCLLYTSDAADDC